MAITVTHIQGEAGTTAAQSVTFATSFLPVAGRYYLVVVRYTASSQMSLNAAGEAITHGGTGLTLTRIDGASVRGQQAADTNGHRLSLWGGFATGSPTTGVFTVDAGELGTSITSRQYELIECTGVHATTPIPQDDINTEFNTSDGTITFTLAGGFVDGNSFTLSALGCCVVDSDYTVPTGWTQLSTRGNTGPIGRLKVAYENGNDSTADWSGGDTGGTQDLAGFIVEIGAAAAGAGPIAGTSAGTATVTGTLTGTGLLAGTSAGVATVTGVLGDVVGQVSIPDATISAGDWVNELASATDLHLSVDEYPTANDADYIESGVTASTVRLRMSDILPPEFTP